MSIDHPQVLWFLLALLPIAVVQWHQYRRGREDLAALAGTRHASALPVYLVKWFFSSLFFLLAVAFMILALAGFSWGQESVEEDRRGLDVVFAVDVSRSMLARDVDDGPRIGAAREIMRGVFQELQAARFGIVVFSSRALTAVPVTEDRVAVDSFIRSLATEVLSARGTDLEQGLSAAFAAFPESANRNRAIVLLSDGEQHRGNALRPAETAGTAGVPVFTVTLGSAEGSTIRLGDGNRLTDADGNVVLSRADSDIMEEIAETSGAEAYSGAAARTVPSLLRAMEGFEERREREGFRLVPVPRYRLFAGAAVIALGLSMFVRIFRWKGIV
ncbi:MAG: VWA domain-containing protein [Spirochaetaceae bacterium]